jgi:amino acid adenylation domain-containing protein
MSMLKILEELKRLNVVPRLEGGQLKLFGDTQNLDEGFIRRIRDSKAELMAFLQSSGEELTASAIHAVAKQDAYPASGAQKRLWLLSQLEGGSAAYNIITSLHAKGRVVKELLEEAFRLSVQRHESLRTVFTLVEGELYQLVLEDFSFKIESRKIASTDIKEGLAYEIEQCTRRPFDLEHELPIRVSLFELAEDEHALVLSLHHIIADGWSVVVLLREVMRNYKALCKNEPVEIQALTIQYKDYTNWLAQRTESVRMQQAKEFWQAQFASKPEPLDLPYDLARPAHQSFEGAAAKFYFDADLCAGITNHCRKQQVTLFNFLRASLTILLHKFSGQDDITIGTPVAGRNHRELEQQVGLYVNTLPLRVSVPADESFIEFARTISASSLRMLEHQDYPLDRIVEDAGGNRDAGRNPLFDVVMALQDTAIGDGSLQLGSQHGFELSRLDQYLYGSGPAERGNIFSKFDLNFNFGVDPGNRIYLDIEYATKVFGKERIKQFFNAYQYIISQVLAQPSMKLSAVKVVAAQEEQRMLEQQQAQSVGYPQTATITSLFEAQVERTPGNIAVVFENTSLTYTELNERSNRLAHYLRENYWIKSDDLVGIKLERGLEMIVSILAILKASGAYVPVDPQYPQERIDYMIADSNCKTIIDESELQKFYSTETQYSSANPSHINKANDLAYVIYTSGTTGKPKGSLIEHKNVVRLLVNDQPLFDFNESDVWTIFHSYCFDFSVWEMYGALLFGGKLVVVPSLTAKDPNAFRSLLQSEGVTILNQTPSAFYQLIKEELEQDDAALQLRYVIFGGEALSPGKLSGWHVKYPATALINMYGITETTVHVTYKEITGKEISTNSASIGKPIPTLSCYVFDQYGHLAPVGVYGELYVGGEGVCRGYLNREELTAKKFIDSPFKTGEKLYRSGDKAKILANGELEYGGRIDDQVKIRGYRIELGEIENAFRRNSKIEDVVLIAKADAKGEMNLIAYLVSPEQLNITELRLELAAQLPSYMLPNHYVQLDKLPLTSNGKIDKKNLPEPDGGLDTAVQFVAPRTNTEKVLVGIWQELLDRENISVKDNFFEIGGHSLKATRLASQVYKAFDVKIALKDLFTYVVLEDQARFIDEAQRSAFRALEPVAKQNDYALSSAQKRLWVLSQLEQGNEAYNIPAAYIFEGAIDHAALENAFTALIERHESLRTAFTVDAHGQARQAIQSPEQVAFRIGNHDLRTENIEENYIKKLVQNEFVRPFDLSAGPLLRATLYRLGDERWIFTYVMHHIVTDGWSMSILIKELLLLYNVYAAGGVNPLVPLRIQYKDYAGWQQKQSSAHAAHEVYWLQQLEGELPILQLAGDQPRPVVKTYNGATIGSTIDAGLSNGLRTFSQQKGGTLFMGLLAAVNTLLHRYTGQEDIITGTQIAGRDHADLDDQIGLYLNTLALRTRFSRGDSFGQLFDHIKKITLGAYEHQSYPFDELVDALQLQGDRSRHPLFDVSVVLQTADLENILEDQQLPGVSIKKYEALENTISKFDLAFDFVEQGEIIQARLVYNTDVYTKTTAQQLLAHFEQLLAAAMAEPSNAISRLDYLNEEEKQHLLVSFNDTQIAYPSDRSIAELFEEQATKTPGNIALVFENKQLTYRELNEQSNRLANYLRAEHSIQADDRIALMVDRSEWLMIAILGILKSGAAYVPVDAAYPKTRKSFILEDTSAKLLVTQSDHIFDLDYYSGSIFAIDVQLDGLETSSSTPESINKSTDLAYVMYTSGSTGTPKGVLVEHRSVVRLVKASNYISFTGEEVILSTGAVSFDATTFEYWGALLNGGKLVLCSTEALLDEQKLAAAIAAEGVDMMWFTSGWLNQLVDKDISVFAGLKTILAGGDKLSPAHIQLVRETYPDVRIVNGYGPTENTTFSLTYEVKETVDLIPVGRPISNSTAYILDTAGQLCPVGVRGEICVGGDGLSRGYLNQEELTQQKFVAHPFEQGQKIYKTGDLGRWLPDGNIEFLGRKDDQVKIRGYRIELGEIERTLQNHEAVDAVVVIAGSDASGEQQLIAYITGSTELSATELRTHIGKTLPSYMVPDHFVQLEAFPLTAHGKVDKRALPAAEGLGLESGTEYIAPATETEQKLSGIWSEILGKEKISVKDNFFEIGGHSLKATRLGSQIHKLFDVRVELKDLFSKVTLEEQAQLIDDAKKTAFVSIQPLAGQPDYALSSSQRRLWALSQLEEVNRTYNIPVAYMFEGNLDMAALENAFTALTGRHEILRTLFKENAYGEIRQVIKTPGTAFSIGFTDLRSAGQPLLHELVQEEFTRPFNLGTGPLLRAHLYQVAGNQWVFTYVMHHIISDGWSMGILMKELLQFYNNAVNGHAHTLSGLAIQYKDYAAWQQEQLHSDALQQHKAYWQEQFAGTLPVLQLPVDKTRPTVPSKKGSVVVKQLDAKLTEALRTLSQEQGGTLFMGLLSAVNVLLHRYTNQHDMIIGTPIANREHADLEGQIGFYLNTLALRTRFQPTDSFSELFANVRRVTLGGFEHQAYPFDELVDELQLRRDLGRNLLFDVMILLQNFETGNSDFEQDLAGVSVKRYHGGEHVVSKYDLTFYFTETVNGLRADIEYNTDIFEHDTIVRVGEYLEQILAGIIANPSASVQDLVLETLGGGHLPVTIDNKPIDKAACSEHQKRLWFIDQFEKNYLYEGSPVYHNLPLLVKMNGADVELLEAGVQKALQQFSILRTNLKAENSEPVQVIAEQAFQGIGRHRSTSADLWTNCLQLIGKPFDLEKDLLVRFDLVSDENGAQVFIITAHHSVADRQSLRILFHTIIGKDQNTEEIASYAAFSDWQNALDAQQLEPASFYWKRKLENAPVLYLDTDQPREHIHIYKAATSMAKLDESLSNRVEEFCNAHNVPAAVFFLTAFKALLHRYTAADEIVIGTFNGNRAQQVLANMVGPLANLVTLKTAVSGEYNFSGLLQQVLADHKNSVDFGAMPFEQVVLDVNPGKDMSRTALFDVLMHYEEESVHGFEEVEFNRGLGKYDLNLLVKKDRGYGFYLTYNEKYFDAPRIEHFLDHYEAIIAQAVNQPSQAIGEMEYLGEAEKNQLLSVFNTSVSYPTDVTIIHLFEAQVERTPGNTAVVFEGASLTYAELNERANRLANYLREQYAISSDDLVGIRLERGLEMIVAILAILKSGGAYVPIDPNYPQERIDYMISDSNCQALIDDAELQKFYAEEDNHGSENLFHINKPGDLAYVIYTSGTTGKPKGSLIEHRNVVRLLVNDQPLFDFNDSDVWTMFHSYCFDFSVWEMYGALLFGGKLVVVPSLTAKDPGAFRNLLQSEGVTVLNQTPSAFYQLIKEELEQYDAELQLRCVIFGGEALSPGKLSDWYEKYPQTELINMYGITETTVHVTYKKITYKEIIINSAGIGKPIPTLSCYVFDQYGHLAPVGVSGELYVGGEGVCRGYLNREELTAKKFIDNPFKAGEKLYRSGDKAKMLANGELEYAGRIDDQVKIRGYRIELGEIENAFRRNSKIEDVVLIAKPDARGEMNLIAYLVSAEKLNITELRLELAAQLPAYMLPGYYVQLDQLPLTSNGKINKKNLPDPQDSGVESGVAYLAPRTATEGQLVAIWQELLGRERISIKDNFFEIGGHSLKATRLASQIYKTFGVKLALKDLFTHVLLEDLSQFIDAAQKTDFLALQPVAQQSDYVLSSSQRRLWVLSQFDESSAAYNMPGVYIFEGQLDHAALDHAFNVLIARHESLRTVFIMNAEGEIRQRINTVEQTNFRIAHKDLYGESDETIKRAIRQECIRAFDLANGPLLRASLYQTGEDRWVFAYVMHHIIGDGWSMGILMKEVLQSYNAYVNGTPVALAPLRIQYKDYAAWQQSTRSTLDQQKNYWIAQLSGELPVLELAGDKVRPAVKTYNGGVVHKTIDAATAKKLQSISQEEGATLFMGLLAAVNALLHRYTGQEDIILGSPIAGRQHADLEDQIGFYLNTLALRTRFRGEDNFRELLQIVKQLTLGAYENQLYPFDELVNELNLPRNLSRSPLFDVMVILQNTENQSLGAEVANLEVKAYQESERLTKFDLLFNFAEENGAIRLDLEYNTDIYKKNTALRLCNHLEQLIRALIEQPVSPINRVDYLRTDEVQQLLEGFNDTRADFPGDKTLVELFEAQAATSPEQVALVFGESSFTFRELNERSNQLAHYLRNAYRINTDELVGMQLERSEWMIISILAALKAGGAYLPIDPEYPQERIDYIVIDSGCKVVIDEEELENFRNEKELHPKTNPIHISNARSLAYVIYTSGSTGKPKGCMLENRGVVNRLEWMWTHYGFTTRDVILQKTTFTFDVSVWELFLPLCWGAKMILCRRDDIHSPERIASLIEQHSVSCLHFVPGMLNAFIASVFEDEHIAKRLHSLRRVITSGEALATGTVHSWYRKIQAPIHNLYGPTEASVDVTYYATSPEDNIIPIGRPIWNTQMYITGKAGELMPVGAVGEISIGGAGLARGYLNKPGLTKEKFVANPFHTGAQLYKTGDLGRWLEDGNIEYIGRKDDQVKIRGFRIELGEIENTLQTHPSIDATVVITRTDRQGEKELAAYIVSKEVLNAAELRSWLKALLPVYMVPAHFVQLDSLPLTPNGKTDRKRLPEPEGFELGSGAEYVAPANDIEEKLVFLWQDVLGREKIGIKDNFFDLGGHSLKALLVASHIQKEFAVNLGVKDVFMNPTIESMSNIIRVGQWVEGAKTNTRENRNIVEV